LGALVLEGSGPSCATSRWHSACAATSWPMLGLLPRSKRSASIW